MPARAEATGRTAVRVAPVVADIAAAAISASGSAIAATAASGAVAALEEGISAATLAAPTARAAKATAHVAAAHAAALVSLGMCQLDVTLLAADDLLGIGDGRLGGLFRLKDDEAKVARAISLTIKGSLDVFNLMVRVLKCGLLVINSNECVTNNPHFNTRTIRLKTSSERFR